MQIKFTKEFVEGLAVKLAEVIKEEQGQNLRVKDFEYEEVPVTICWSTSGYSGTKLTIATVILDNRLEILSVPVEIGNTNSLTMRTPLVKKITERVQIFLGFATQWTFSFSLKTFFSGMFNHERVGVKTDLILTDELILSGGTDQDGKSISLELHKGDKVLCQFNDISVPHNPNSGYGFTTKPTPFSPDYSMVLSKIYEAMGAVIETQRPMLENTLTIQTETFIAMPEYNQFRNALNSQCGAVFSMTPLSNNYQSPGATGY